MHILLKALMTRFYISSLTVSKTLSLSSYGTATISSSFVRFEEPVIAEPHSNELRSDLHGFDGDPEDFLMLKPWICNIHLCEFRVYLNVKET